MSWVKQMEDIAHRVADAVRKDVTTLEARVNALEARLSAGETAAKTPPRRGGRLANQPGVTLAPEPDAEPETPQDAAAKTVGK